MKKILLLIFLIISIATIFVFDYLKNRDIALFAKHFENFHVEYPFRSSTNFYNNIADGIFSVEINRDDITQYIYRASLSDDKEMQKIEREKLYKKLQPLYMHLRALGIKQLHFHFKDATSFLRFHKPSKFGDNLTNIRETVVYVNKHQKSVRGFEEGRIFNGYRFVYPIYYKNRHVGSVEVSIGFSAISTNIAKSFNTQTYMMLRDSVVENKVFTDEKRNYEPSFISKYFYHEANTFDDSKQYITHNTIFTSEMTQEIFAKFNNKLDDKLLAEKKFFIYNKLHGINYVLNFIPIQNFKKENIGYIVFLNESGIFENFHQQFIYRTSFSILLALLLLLFIYYLMRKNELISQSEIKAKKATQAKSEFLANMSHEIRTPLNAIYGYLHLLKKEIHDPKAKEYINTIESSSETLLNVINDILDFSKLESNKIQLNDVTFNPYREFENIYKMFLPLCENKTIKLTFIASNDLPNYLQGDLLRLKQIVTNLLSNAVKFTPEKGSIELNISYSNNFLLVKVIDSGIGIKPEALKNIFKKFTQADSSTTRKYGGTGLGLTISMFLVELFGGKLNVESIFGQGSTFFFEIPLSVATETVDDAVEEMNTNIQLSGNVLLVEDNKTNQMLMEIILEELSINVILANDGLEAVEQFKKYHNLDMILMDENMPNMNGIEATKIILELQKSEGYKETPIIALTADALDGARKKYLDAGMKDYLTKPLEEEALMKVLFKYLHVKVK